MTDAKRMTPEERAQKLSAYLANWLCVGIGDIAHGEIVDAIRAAEDDALERAARYLDDSDQDLDDGWCTHYAQQIRSLKSTGGSR